MSFIDFVLYATLVGYALYITRVNNMWGVSKGTQKVKTDVRTEKKLMSKRKKANRNLRFLAKFDDIIGFSMTPVKEEDLNYKISRMGWRVKVLDREIRAKELSGLFKLIQVSTSFIGAFIFIWTGNPIALILVIGALTPTLFNTWVYGKITSEDELLEREFPDLYLVLYTRLVQGKSARISPVLQDFLASLNALNTGDDAKEILRQFTMDLINNIELYGDDTLAIRRLRDKYRSVMVINFTNLAVQALNGVDNRDKLLTFKNELNHKRVDYMQARADKMVTRGEYAVWAIYIILFQFILLSWVAKLSQTGGLGNLF